MAHSPRITDSGIEIKPVYTAADAHGDDSQPGHFPYTRGVHPGMYTSRLWTMRQYAGFSTAEESNKRYHYLLGQGVMGLSVAFDLPTQIGYDSDHPMAEGEVGKVGVAIDSLEDMQELFKGIPLQGITTSMTINATASTLLALYIALAKQQGADIRQISGTIQNDILKEYAARGTYIYPPKPSMRIITDIFAYCTAEVPKWNTISISGYHIREAGSSAVQELAFTLANGKAYVQAAMAVGLDPNAFGKRLSFFFNAHNNFFQEVAKFRAARRMWAHIMRELGATEPEALKLRFHTQTGGSTLTAQQPENNIVRVAIQAFSAVCGGTQSLHTNGFDEAISLPTENAARTALRTQQIIAAETGAADTVDPFAGSYFIEAMTDELEAKARELMARIDAMGGAVDAIEQGFMQDEIARASYAYQKGVEDGSVQIVGVNTHKANDTVKPEIFKVDNSIGDNQARKLAQLRNQRNAEQTTRSLDAVRACCTSGENLMPALVSACEAYATLGEIADVLRQEFGEFAG